MSDLVSVVIPAYNSAPFVYAAISSVLLQSYEAIEIIVINDGSTDDTGAVLEPLRPRVRYRQTANQGAAAARNLGLEMAAGRYVAFLDADDLWHPCKIACQVDTLTQHPRLGAVFTNIATMNAAGELIDTNALHKHYRLFKNYPSLSLRRIFDQRAALPLAPTKSIDLFYGDIFEHLFLGNFIPTPSILFRRSLLETTGTFDSTLDTQEDYDLWLRMAGRAAFGVIDYPLPLIRRWPHQLTQLSGHVKITNDVLRVIRNQVQTNYHQISRELLNLRMSDLCLEKCKTEIGARNYRCLGRFLLKWLHFFHHTGYIRRSRDRYLHPVKLTTLAAKLYRLLRLMLVRPPTEKTFPGACCLDERIV